MVEMRRAETEWSDKYALVVEERDRAHQTIKQKEQAFSEILEEI